MTLSKNSDVLAKLRQHMPLHHQTIMTQTAAFSKARVETKLAKTMIERVDFLKPIPLFASLRDSELRAVAQDLIERRFKQGEPIFYEGDAGQVLYLVNSGQVRIFVNGDSSGIETSVILCGRRGDIFGELAIVDGLPRSATALAMEDTSLYTLNREAFIGHMRRIPQLSLNFMKLLSVRVRYNTHQVKSLASQSVAKRLARKLLELARDYGVVHDQGVRINTSLNQTELASLIGATRESTNKALSIFRKQDLIRKHGDHITIMDPESLRKQIND